MAIYYVSLVKMEVPRIPLHLGTLNDLTSHLTVPVIGKDLELLQKVKHREKPCLQTQVIDHNIH